MNQAKPDYRLYADLALKAFWAVFIEHCPEAAAGKAFPWAANQLFAQIEDVINEWIGDKDGSDDGWD